MVGNLTKDQQGAEPGQIASEYSGATDAAAGAAGEMAKVVSHLILRFRVAATSSSAGSISLIWLCALFFVQRDAGESGSFMIQNMRLQPRGRSKTDQPLFIVVQHSVDVLAIDSV